MWTLHSLLAPKRRVHRARAGCFRPSVEALEERSCPSGGTLEWDDPGDIQGQAYAVLIQPSDGKIVAAGNVPTTKGSLTLQQFGVVRYTPGGTLDTSFGSGGKVATVINKGYSAQVGGVGIQANGKLVVSGFTYGRNGVDFALVRYNANGTLYSTFGNQGIVTTDFGGNDFGGPLVIQPDGKIVVAGQMGMSTSVWPGPYAELARYNANGSLDSTFGNQGKVKTAIGLNNSLSINALALQGNGQIVIAGDAYVATGQRGFEVARYNANGSLDSAFGAGGIVSTPVGPSDAVTNQAYQTHAQALALDSSGRYVVAGTTVTSTGREEWVLVRYNPAGSLDASFGSGGLAITHFTATSEEVARGLALQADGKMVVAGIHGDADTNYQASFALGRYNPDGSLDNTFNGTGTVTTAFSADAQLRAVTIQPDGRIVAAGGVGGVFAVARYLPSAPQVGSFTADPNPVTSGSSTTLTAANLTDGNPATTITQVAFSIVLNGSQVLLGYGTQTSSGVWSFTFDTTGLASGTYTLYAQAKDSYGVLGDLVALTLTIK